MGNQDTRPNLSLTYRADPGHVFVRTMKAVEIGNRALLETIEQVNYDDAMDISRRMTNLWLEGHYAHLIMTLNGNDVTLLSCNRQILLDRHRELLTLLEMLINSGISPGIRATTSVLLSLLADIRIPQLPSPRGDAPHYLSPKLSQ